MAGHGNVWMLLQQQQIDFQSRAEQLAEPNRELTLARLDITVMDQHLQDWVISQAGVTPPALTNPSSEDSGKWLLVVDMPGRKRCQESTSLVLSEVCSQISALGIDPASMTSCSTVQGSIQILSTVAPCLSTIGALWQFTARFQTVSLTFVEQVLQTDLVGVEHTGERNG